MTVLHPGVLCDSTASGRHTQHCDITHDIMHDVQTNIKVDSLPTNKYWGPQGVSAPRSGRSYPVSHGSQPDDHETTVFSCCSSIPGTEKVAALETQSLNVTSHRLFSKVRFSRTKKLSENEILLLVTTGQRSS
ncbi:Hypothetical predicted protein [Podarcis lilfordi]|uniref:Uncharacterized protein n=1 Tax=Podarcis lilfordi TaxID=74358 RepID=A0AA35K813_9SAUR|nr:Hypothetical predicted protein [Podarcis lilfordi]